MIDNTCDFLAKNHRPLLADLWEQSIKGKFNEHEVALYRLDDEWHISGYNVGIEETVDEVDTPVEATDRIFVHTHPPGPGDARFSQADLLHTFPVPDDIETPDGEPVIGDFFPKKSLCILTHDPDLIGGFGLRCLTRTVAAEGRSFEEVEALMENLLPAVQPEMDEDLGFVEATNMDTDEIEKRGLEALDGWADLCTRRLPDIGFEADVKQAARGAINRQRAVKALQRAGFEGVVTGKTTGVVPVDFHIPEQDIGGLEQRLTKSSVVLEDGPTEYTLRLPYVDVGLYDKNFIGSAISIAAELARLPGKIDVMTGDAKQWRPHLETDNVDADTEELARKLGEVVDHFYGIFEAGSVGDYMEAVDDA